MVAIAIMCPSMMDVVFISGYLKLLPEVRHSLVVVERRHHRPEQKSTWRHHDVITVTCVNDVKGWFYLRAVLTNHRPDLPDIQETRDTGGGMLL